MNNFPWYVINKDTKYIIAGFVEYSNAVAFCSTFTHGMYVVRDHATMASIVGV